MRSNTTGVGFYNSEQRNFSRGSGRGSPRPFQPSQPRHSPQPPRRGDLFIEAGRLAVEYLVSHGLLSSNVLSGEFQNGSLRNNSGEIQGLRSSQDRDSNRRSPNDQDLSLTRNYLRERRRLGSSRSYSSDLSRENEREGSLSAKASSPKTMEVDDEKFHKDTTKDADNEKFHEDTTKDADTVVHNSCPAESAAKEKRHSELQDDSKMNSSVPNKDDEDNSKASDGVNTGYEETKDGIGNHDKEIELPRDELPNQHCEDNNDASTKDNSALSKSCPSDVPTKIDISVIGHDSLDPGKNETMSGSSGIPSSNEIPSSNCLNGIPSSTEIPISNCLSAAPSDYSLGNAGAIDPAYAIDQQRSMESRSFTDKTFSYEQNSSLMPEIGVCSPVATDRGEKRPPKEADMAERAKRAKQWLSVARNEDYSQLSDLSDHHSISPAKNVVAIFSETAHQESFSNVSLPLKGGVESDIDQGEKQLFSNSFKICDLNLMEASDMHENHGIPALLYRSLSAPNRDVPVDIDLSMRNSGTLTDDYNDSGSVRKEIEIIDLESGSLEEGKILNTSTKNIEAGITNMESFPHNPQNSNDNPDGQDGYGFMISELLGNDVPNCSSVQPDMNSLHNDMNLHHAEGMFSEDDPIYMSLGEIPLSLLRVWEQPTQERNPFEL